MGYTGPDLCKCWSYVSLMAEPSHKFDCRSFFAMSIHEKLKMHKKQSWLGLALLQTPLGACNRQTDRRDPYSVWFRSTPMYY